MNNTLEIHGKQFDIINKGRKQWQTEYRNAIVTKGDSRVDVIEKLKSYNKTELIKGCDNMDVQVKRDDYFKANTELFTRIFGFAPPRDFLMYYCGCGLQLDVIKLDEKLHTPDGISTNDHILNTYGHQALDMVKNMIQIFIHWVSVIGIQS